MTDASTTTDLCVQCFQAMADTDRPRLDQLVHPEAVNREAASEPAAARAPGPAGFHSTATWLRSAFSDLRWEVLTTVQEGDLIAMHTTMSGRHTGPFVTYTTDLAIDTVMPPTGKRFTVTQTHWFRVKDGLIIEHWANRDDLGMARQAGWVPPSPAFLLRAAIAKRQALRHASD
jgi:predicted ester cyclase